jgi:NADP-dependent 3-hydroxy acid dehydrogenase YdfG
MVYPRDSLVRSGVTEWLTRVLSESGAAFSADVVQKLRPEIERALRAAALDMLRQLSVAQFGESDVDAFKEWDVSVNEAVIAAIKILEHKRQDG